jgi:hypothetical protein
MHGLDQKYSPVVRYSPNKLSSIEAEIWKEMYSHHAPQWPKDLNFLGQDPYGNAPGLIRADGNSHSRQRKPVSHVFSDKALSEQEHVVKHYVSLLVEELQQDANTHDGTVNLISWFNFTTLATSRIGSLPPCLHALTFALLPRLLLMLVPDLLYPMRCS